MKPRSLPLPALTALTVLLGLAHLPAQAIGRLADVTIVDRDTGATLPVHYARGEYWVAGRPGARYAITVRNRLGERVLAVPSVDGVNVLSGETAAWDQRGYVFSPYERYQITGWRKSDSQVAAFEFSHIANSYAARTGRPAHVGVIGVALFREQPPVPQPAPTITPEPYSQRRDNGLGLGRLREEPASPQPLGLPVRLRPQPHQPRQSPLPARNLLTVWPRPPPCHRPSWARPTASARPRSSRTRPSRACRSSPTKSSASATTAART